MAEIFIDSLGVECVIGVHDWERGSRQRLEITVTLTTDLARATASDDVAATVDYTAVAARITTLAVTGAFRLIETLAERIATALLEAYPLSEVEVEIRKPAALANARTVGVRVHRARP